MNMTIAIKPSGELAALNPGTIAAATGENTPETAFSLHFASLAISELPITPVDEVAVDMTQAMPATAPEAAMTGNPLPVSSGKTLPGLPPLPPMPSLPIQLTADGASQSVPGGSPPADQPPMAATLSKPMAQEAKALAPAHGPNPAPATAPGPAPAFDIAIMVQASDPAKPVQAPTAQTSAASGQIALPVEKSEMSAPRSEAQVARPATGQPVADATPSGSTSEQPQTRQEGGKSQDGRGQDGKPAAGPQAQPTPSSANVLTTPLSTPASVPTAGEIAPPNFRTPATELRPQEFETIVQRLAEARETARPAQADLHLLHREFGHVAMQLEVAGRQLKVSLNSADAGFAPAVQAALAERLPLQALDMPRGEQSLASANQNTSGHQASAQGSPNTHGGPAAPSGQPGAGRDGSPSQSSRSGDPAPQSRTDESRDERRARDSGLFA